MQSGSCERPWPTLAAAEAQRPQVLRAHHPGVTNERRLYVDGNLDSSGNFNWTSLIFVEGMLNCTGTMNVLGGVMCRGGGQIVAVDFGSGTPNILYSRAALVQTLMRAMDYIVLSWKEM